MKMLTAFTMTVPGIPIIYYGDEIGMPGAGDPDNRRMMRFSGLTPAEESVRSTAEKLGNIRRSSLALSYGDTRILRADKDQFVYLRQYFDKTDLIVMNRSDSSASISIELPEYVNMEKLKAHFGNKISVNGQKITTQLKPLSFEIVEN